MKIQSFNNKITKGTITLTWDDFHKFMGIKKVNGITGYCYPNEDFAPFGHRFAEYVASTLRDERYNPSKNGFVVTAQARVNEQEGDTFNERYGKLLVECKLREKSISLATKFAKRYNEELRKITEKIEKIDLTTAKKYLILDMGTSTQISYNLTDSASWARLKVPFGWDDSIEELDEYDLSAMGFSTTITITGIVEEYCKNILPGRLNIYVSSALCATMCRDRKIRNRLDSLSNMFVKVKRADIDVHNPGAALKELSNKLYVKYVELCEYIKKTIIELLTKNFSAKEVNEAWIHSRNSAKVKLVLLGDALGIEPLDKIWYTLASEEFRDGLLGLAFRGKI